MSDAAFRFVSWLRRGVASQIASPDASGAGPPRASIPIEVAFNGGANTAALSLTVQGPGDVVGFDERVVTRVWPPRDTHDAEPNYFPLLEFNQVDLPWRYMPRGAAGTGRLRPWFCLLALEDNEHSYEPSRADRALGKIAIAAGTPMPRIDQAWAWAHVQVTGNDAVSIGDLVARAPSRCIARVLSPRRLDPHTAYTAVLVPIFEVGRRAGLRLPLGESASTLGDAWSVSAAGTLTAPLELPVYYRWRFGTGAGGDFESLVRLLAPRPLPANVGLRALDASSPGGSLPAASAAPLALGGALQVPVTTPPPWTAVEKGPFVTALGQLLDLPANVRTSGGAPIVAPPLYGTWHARRERLQSSPPWFQHLNEDPRTRVAASLGTQVIQNQQHELMADAWLQVAGIREANDQLRRAQLGRAVSERVHARFLQPSNADEVLALASATLGRVKHGAQTVRALALASPVKAGVTSSAFRRMARPLGPLGRRQGRAGQPRAPVITRVNDGTYASILTPTPPAPDVLSTHEWLEEQQVPWPGPPSADQIESQPLRPRTVAWDPIYGDNVPSEHSDGNADSPSMAAFRAAALEYARRDTTPAPGEVSTRLDLTGVRTAVTTALHPSLTFPLGFAQRLVRSPGFVWNPPDSIEPVMAHPEFAQPMYVPLAAISQDWILPGLSTVSANTVALAETNPAFIEAYMVGLNHEMSRELLWNEYPTDQRGSYFRQFWDPTGYAPAPVPETAKDIHRLHEWPPTSDLGQHSPRPAPPSSDGRHLVLLIRGEVLRRYPGTLIYAQRAQGALGQRTLASEQRKPVFSGQLTPDVTFVGFELTAAQVRGGASDPGWFFVFEEQPSEPRVGLDANATSSVPASFNDLAWTHLAASPEALAAIGYIDLAAALPNTAALEVAGGAAWHMTAAASGKPFARGSDHAAITYQRPVRVAMHAADLLPPS